MASKLIKIASIGGGLATATGAGVGIAYLTSDSPQKLERIATADEKIQKTPETKTKKAISEGLSSDNKVLLEDGNSKGVDKWDIFKKAHPAEKPPKAVGGFTDGNTLLNGDGTKFKEKCTKLAEEQKETKEDELYKEIKEYCTTDKVQTPS